MLYVMIDQSVTEWTLIYVFYIMIDQSMTEGTLIYKFLIDQ